MENYTEDIRCEFKNSLDSVYQHFHNCAGLSPGLDVKLRNSLNYIYHVTESLPEKYSRQFNYTFQLLMKLIQESNFTQISVIESLDIIFKVGNLLLDTSIETPNKLNKRCSETAKAMFYLINILGVIDPSPVGRPEQDRSTALYNFNNMRRASLFTGTLESNVNARACYTILKDIYNSYYPEDMRETYHIPRWRIPFWVILPKRNKDIQEQSQELIGDDTADFKAIPEALLSTLDAPTGDEFPDIEINAEA